MKVLSSGEELSRNRISIMKRMRNQITPKMRKVKMTMITNKRDVIRYFFSFRDVHLLTEEEPR